MSNRIYLNTLNLDGFDGGGTPGGGGGGGNAPSTPDVPTLECWKITTADNDLKLMVVENAGYTHGLMIGAMDGDVYANLYPIIGTGSPQDGEQTFYLLFFNKGDYYETESANNLIDLLSQNAGERISLSTFLDVAATAKGYDD